MNNEEILQKITNNPGKEIKLPEVKEEQQPQQVNTQNIDMVNRIISSPFDLSATGGFRNRNKTLIIDSNGYIHPVSINNAVAPNNSIYYSTDANKLVYKDSDGNINNLY